MALKMAAQKQSLKELLVPSTDDVILNELNGDITPPHSDIGSLSPKSEVSTPSSPEDYQYPDHQYSKVLTLHTRKLIVVCQKFS